MNRYVLLLVLVLLGVSARHPEPDPQPVAGVSISAAQPAHDVLHDRPRGPVAVGNGPASVWPDSSWGVCRPAAQAGAASGWRLVSVTGGVRAAVCSGGRPPSRAPPAA